MESKTPNQGSYMMDSSDGAEMARLIDQDIAITRATGVFPANIALLNVDRMLDAACGPGGWTRTAAGQHPDVEIVGIDINAEMIDYASAFASLAGLTNLSFKVMDITRPLAFADASFDLVHARFLVGLIYRHVWPVLVKEFARVTRPGGWIVLAETDRLITTNSEAAEAIMELCLQAMTSAGFYAGLSGKGVIPQLAGFLTEAGLVDIQSEPFVIDISYGSVAHPAIVSNIKIGYMLLQPFLLKMGLSSSEELQSLYTQTVEALESGDFRGHLDLTRVWGRKL